ncbi:coiled-coil domain-containing protein 57 isoform X5 [Larimichthys crocea]|uniref:coiled-coil domain-containing protein 57 isoform X5 n=1 Tax=Larimichthys crocea TaxID=215358 RepID=UPI000F5E342B|nr:coiled-coil domain-containing protein 57 isoform X5 [Larimichthys crocea]
MYYGSSTMHSDGDSALESLEAQLVTKEMEWKEFLATRVHQLEHFLKKAQEECSSLSSMADGIKKQTEEYDRMKWNLQFRIQEMEQELSLQRQTLPSSQHTALHSTATPLPSLFITAHQEMTAAFDSELRQQEHKFNLTIDEVRAVVLSHDLKVKLLSNETKVHCQAHLRTIEALKASKKFCQQIQTQLQHKEQEVKDLTAVKDYRIKELKGELKQMETKLKESEDNHIKKYEDVIQALKKCDSQLEAQFQAHTEQLQKTEKHLVKLQKKMKVLAQAQEDQQKAMKQKDETIQRLCTEVETTRTGWDKYITKVSSEMVVKDTEIITLQEKVTKHRTEWDSSREEIEWYKQQLSDGLKREKGLEQMRVQAELEWQNRCEDMKAEHYLANEQLLHDLTKTREQSLTIKVDSMASEEISGLQKQNNILRAVVTQMRKDMEGLSHPLLNPQAQPQVSFPQPVQCQEAPAQTVTGPPPQSTDISTNVSPAGGVCLEKHANTSAPLTKQEIRVTHVLDQGAKSNPPLLHTRLKQAAFCIARLSTEKQQLIEMCNCLRGQINTARLKERDSCTEILEEQHDRLNALEQLQYQLTTQELQYALRQSACTFAEQLLLGTNNQGPATKGAANHWSQVHRTTDTTESSKNKDSAPLSQSQSSPNVGPQPHSGLSRSQLSSEEESTLQSLNNLWEILDHGLSLSVFSEGEGELSREEVAESSGAGVQMIVHGISVPIHSQPPTEIQQKRNPSATPSNPTKTCRSRAPDRISKIRNYNVKD